MIQRLVNFTELFFDRVCVECFISASSQKTAAAAKSSAAEKQHHTIKTHKAQAIAARKKTDGKGPGLTEAHRTCEFGSVAKKNAKLWNQVTIIRIQTTNIWIQWIEIARIVLRERDLSVCTSGVPARSNCSFLFQSVSLLIFFVWKEVFDKGAMFFLEYMVLTSVCPPFQPLRWSKDPCILKQSQNSNSVLCFSAYMKLRPG